MKIIKPYTITDAMLTSSVPEPDASAGEIAWTAGTYTLGTRRILTSTHKVYEVVADPSTTDAPDVGAAKAVPTWIVVSSTNRWAVFDEVVGNQSTGSSPLTVAIETGQIVNGVAAFNLSNITSANITVTDPVDGIVYDTDVDLTDDSQIVDWYAYFFEDIVRKTEFVLTDLPAYKNAEVLFTFTGDSNVGVGEIVVGKQFTLGVANYGTSVQLLDFSRKERDEFGNFTIIRRRTSKLTDFDVTVEKSRINYVFNQLASLTTVPCVWIGTDETDDATLVYGYYKDSQINIDAPTICSASITVEGLT